MKAAPVALGLALLLGLGCEERAREFRTIRITHTYTLWAYKKPEPCMQNGQYLDGTVSFGARTITGSRAIPCDSQDKVWEADKCIQRSSGPLYMSQTERACGLCRSELTEERLGTARVDEIEALAKDVVEAAKGFGCTRENTMRPSNCETAIFIDDKFYGACAGMPNDFIEKLSRLETYLDGLPMASSALGTGCGAR